MADENNRKSIENLVSDASRISDCAANRQYDMALFMIDLMKGAEKDALYAGVALGLAAELDRCGEDTPQCKAVVQEIMEYCREKSKYFKPKGGQ